MCQQHSTSSLADVSVVGAAALILPVAVCAGHAHTARVAARFPAAPVVVHQATVGVSHWITVKPGPRRLAHVLVPFGTACVKIGRTDQAEPVIVGSNAVII